MEFQEAKAIAERLGFQLFADVRGDTNALRLFTEDFRQKYGKKYRCGVYMQFRADGSCYIGQSLEGPFHRADRSPTDAAHPVAELLQECGTV